VLVGQDSGIVANLTDALNRPLREETVIFVVSNSENFYSVPIITDFAGRAPLGIVPLGIGAYTVDVSFGGTVLLPEGPLTLENDLYNPTEAVTSLTITLPVDPQPTDDYVRLQFLKGNGNSFAAYQDLRQLLIEENPFTLGTPDLLNVIAPVAGTNPAFSNPRLRLGVVSSGENGSSEDSIEAGEVLSFSSGTDSSVAGRQWQSVELKLNPHGNAVATVSFYSGDTLVGTDRVELSNSIARSQVVLLGAGGRLFDRVELSAESGRYGVKGLQNAAVFYFSEGNYTARSIMENDQDVELYLPIITNR
jgi:hypothetical protein